MANITIVTVDGNIGSGKSTLLENMQRRYADNCNEDYEVVFLKEPVEIWETIRDENDKTILENFYTDQDAFSFPFQIMACVSRVKVLRDALQDIKSKNTQKKVIIITERSLYTDKMVFAKMLNESGKISFINYQIYLNLFETFSHDFPIHKVVYVKTNPERCHSRILKRSRDGESNIPIDYLTRCSDYHEEMLTYFTDEKICEEQLVLDGNIDIYENENQVEEWIQQINRFITV